jgi:hypothetical protein
MNQIFNLKLWMLISLIAGTALVSAVLTTLVIKQSFHSQISTCPPCETPPVKALPNSKGYRVPNDNGETF